MTNLKDKKNKQFYKKAFTLMEILVSVALVAIVVMGAMKLQGQHSDMAIYLLNRGNAELDNALFLTEKADRYSKDQKNAYEMLVDEFSIKDLDSRNLLKNIEKNITVTEEYPMPIGGTDESEPLFIFYSSEIRLNGNYPARYYRFK